MLFRSLVRTYIFVAVLTMSSLLAGVAEARHVHFTGPHPIAAKLGGGYCYIETPHLHAYAPDHQALYQQVGDEYVFTGDPTPFGFDGERYKYYGHHPIGSANGEPIYCFIEGPHFHAVQPPDEGYKVQGGVAFYTGPYAPAYAKIKGHRAKLVNAEYRPYAQYRPVVEVQPPPEWQGEVYVAPPSVQVSAPGVYVNAPAPPGVVVGAPSVEINAPPPPHVQIVAPPPPHVVIGAPPPPHVVIGAPAPHVQVVAPPPPHVQIVAPPPPHVVIGAPAPRVVVGAPAPHVYVGAPPPAHVVVGAPAPGVVVVKGHHDHGKHKGWYK